MRIAAFSDVHSNLPALEAVLEDIERLGKDVQVVVNGDFLNCGPFPRQTLELIRAIPQVLIISGNHEGYILEEARHARNGGRPAPFNVLYMPSVWSGRQLTEEEFEWLAGLPVEAQLDGPDNSSVRIVHGSPRNQIEGIYPEIEEAKLQEIFQDYISPRRLWISGHTHRPTARQWAGMTVTNNGSVGAPLDGDSRASYLYAEWDEAKRDWRVENRRVAYDRERAMKAVWENAAYDQGGPFMKLMWLDLKLGRSCGITQFIRGYIEAGEFPNGTEGVLHFDRAVEKHLARFLD